MADTIDQPRTELDVLAEAAEALREAEELRKAVRASEARLRALCRAYDDAANVRGTAPYHLERSARLQGLLDAR